MGRKRKPGADEVAEPAPAQPAFDPNHPFLLKALQASGGGTSSSATGMMDPDVQELVDNFHIEERHGKKLNEIMAGRVDTFEADMLRLWTDLERANNPNGLLVVQMRQMEQGTFVGKNEPDPEYTKIVEKFKLDTQAEEKLLDTLSRHPKERRLTYYADLEAHLDASSKPSATAMMLLRKIGEGEQLGQPWGKSKSKGNDSKGGRGDDWDRGRDRDRGGGRSRSRDRRGSDDRDRDRRGGSSRDEGRDWGRGGDGDWQNKDRRDDKNGDWNSGRW